MRTRAEHLAFCKARALEYVDQGLLRQAYTSFVSDMSKHAYTKKHPFLGVGVEMLVSGLLDDPFQMRRFIEGFN